jgi:uncharacterized protein (DUF433 family)
VTIGVKNHVVIDESGVAWISGANTKVIQVVLDKLAYGWSAEEIHFQHPHLSLAQIHSALAYYYENKNELDAEIERQSQEAEALKPRLINPALRRKLLNAKKPK